MDERAELFLKLIGSVIKERTCSEQELQSIDASWLYEQAIEQNLVPFLYEALHKNDKCKELPNELETELAIETMRTIARQTQKTAEFLRIYQLLHKAGVRALVLKGIICRDLYGRYADHRESGDEDVWIRIEEYTTCEKVLKEQGYEQQDGEVTEQMLRQMQEVTFYHAESELTLEVHINLVGENTPLAKQMNRAMQGAYQEVATITMDGVTIHTLSPTNHLKFLLLHFMKHFISMGIGIRQMIDILLFAERYTKEIDWKQIRRLIRDFHMEGLVGDLFYIGTTYLGIQAPIKINPVEPEKLIQDMLESGVFGNGTKEHELASHMTIEKFNERKGHWIFHILFPARDQLKQQYPILLRYPWMLPVVWCRRLGKLMGYYFSKKTEDDTIAEASISIGKQRIALLEAYKIIY